ncbi:hypothetical protein HMPREF0682_0317, partial [Propionibacterium acidifaciens F0233]
MDDAQTHAGRPRPSAGGPCRQARMRAVVSARTALRLRWARTALRAGSGAEARRVVG